jgi:hypothetical protein
MGLARRDAQADPDLVSGNDRGMQAASRNRSVGEASERGRDHDRPRMHGRIVMHVVDLVDGRGRSQHERRCLSGWRAALKGKVAAEARASFSRRAAHRCVQMIGQA